MTLSSFVSSFFFANNDSQKTLITQYQLAIQQKTDYEISWKLFSEQNAQWLIYTRLLFLFIDIVYVFANDFSNFRHMIDFLINCIETQFASMLSLQIRSRLVIIITRMTKSFANNVTQMKRFYQSISQVKSIQLSKIFSKISFIHLIDCNRFAEISDERLKKLILTQLKNMRVTWHTYRTLYAASHLQSLFQTIFQHIVTIIEKSFDFIKVMRKRNNVT